jgi:hypothetical protein
VIHLPKRGAKGDFAVVLNLFLQKVGQTARLLLAVRHE